MGVQTVVNTYESVALDEHINSFGLAYGMGMEPEVWQRRLQDFQGSILSPLSPFREKGLFVLPWDRRLEVMRMSEVASARAACNDACAALLREAEASRVVNPIKRSREPRALLMAYRQLDAAGPTAATADAAVSRFRTVVRRCLHDAAASQREGVTRFMHAQGYRLRRHVPNVIDEFGVALVSHRDGATLFVDRANGNIAQGPSVVDLVGMTGVPWEGLWVHSV